MPVELKDQAALERIIPNAVKCKVKLSSRTVKTASGVKERIKVIKVKVKTPRRLYTLVFDNIDEGIKYVKTLKERCSSLEVMDKEIESKL